MDRYLFPAIFEPGEDKGYVVSYPDLPGCLTEGDSMEEALHMAKEALELFLYSMEEDNETVPQPTLPQNISVSPKAFISIIEVWMPIVRDEMENRSIKKTLTIPKWLNDIAEKNKVNFSQILQAALKEYLGVIKSK